MLSDIFFTPDSNSTGWQAALFLVLQYLLGKTCVVQQRNFGPLQVQRAFYPEGKICHLYILHPPGGVVGGDLLSTKVVLQSKAQALFTMPSATKHYRSNGAIAKIKQQFILKDGSELEWLPPSNICFPGCQTKIQSEFWLYNNTRLFIWETFCFGLPILGKTFKDGTLTASLRLWYEEQLLWNEVLRVHNNLKVIAGYPLYSTILIFPANNLLLASIRKVITLRQYPTGATLLNNLLIIRLLDNDNLQLEVVLQKIWSIARPNVLGRNAVIPRIWST